MHRASHETGFYEASLEALFIQSGAVNHQRCRGRGLGALFHQHSRAAVCVQVVAPPSGEVADRAKLKTCRVDNLYYNYRLYRSLRLMYYSFIPCPEHQGATPLVV